MYVSSVFVMANQGGYDALKLDVLLAVPLMYQADLDLQEVAKVFPYGDVRFELQGGFDDTSCVVCDYPVNYCAQSSSHIFILFPQDGGMVAPSGIAIEKHGDKNDDMVVVCASVTVGY